MASCYGKRSSHNKFGYEWGCNGQYEEWHHWFEGKRRVAWDEFVGRFTEENTKLNYYDPIKRQPLKLFEKKTTKKKHFIPESEDQSFADFFAMYDKKKLDFRKIMDSCMTSKPWAIVNEDEMSHINNKHLFRNHLQNLSPIPKTHKVPDNTSTSRVDAMHAIRMISVAGLNPCTLSLMPGNILRVTFDKYSYEYSVSSKQKDVSQMERVINSLNQDLPPTKGLNKFSTVFTFQNLILCTGKLIKNFPCTLFMLIRKTMTQFGLLPIIQISI